MAISRVTIVGAGVIGEAMIHALNRIGLQNSEITIKEKRKERAEELIVRFGVSNSELQRSQAILLAVKPQDLEKTLIEIGPEISDGTLVVSLLAGIKTARIENILGARARVVRVMPNTPVLMGEGMSAISGGKSAIGEDIAWVESLLSKSGATLVVDEELMDAVTATSGSGPAYFFGFAEAMIEGAKKLGLKEVDAKLLVSQTLLGAAKMVSESGKDAKTLRENVTSPNGTTAAALAVFDSNKWNDIVFEAMKAGKERAAKLAN